MPSSAFDLMKLRVGCKPIRRDKRSTSLILRVSAFICEWDHGVIKCDEAAVKSIWAHDIALSLLFSLPDPLHCFHILIKYVLHFLCGLDLPCNLLHRNIPLLEVDTTLLSIVKCQLPQQNITRILTPVFVLLFHTVRSVFHRLVAQKPYKNSSIGWSVEEFLPVTILVFWASIL